ncbi:hypothetical protein NGM37_23470, partial [Streptomyces sp. TRM76130]|nr:hypothetical protein [Streptomyces sp. TRM76130]
MRRKVARGHLVRSADAYDCEARRARVDSARCGRAPAPGARTVRRSPRVAGPGSPRPMDAMPDGRPP